MDANGTRLHLVAGRDDWGRFRPDGGGRTLGERWPEGGTASDADVAWDPERSELTLRPELFLFDAPGAATGPALSDRRGAAVDRFGNWFWIATDESSIRVGSAGSGRTSTFWQPGIGGPPDEVRRPGDFGPLEDDASPPRPPESLTLRGLAVTEDHYLVVGTVEPDGLLVFDLQGGGPPLRLLWPAEVSFHPFDMAARRHGGVFVLDRDGSRLWELDRHLMVVSIGPAAATAPPGSVFRPLTEPAVEPAAPTAAGVVVLDAAAPLEGDPIAVAAARDGTVLVLDRGPGTRSILRRYRGGAVVGPPVPLADPGLGLEVSAYDMALASDDLGGVPAPLGLLYVVGSSGNQAYAFRLSVPDDGLQLAAVRTYLPLRSFGGKALAADGGHAYYDFTDRFVRLAEQRRPRFVREAALVSPPFDGREPGCVWHRLMLDACVPPQTTVEVWSRTAEDPRELDTTAWMREPEPLLRLDGSELPFAPQPGGSYGTYELLFQRAQGRYLELRLRLTGDERTSPRLRAVRVYYPRFSYLVQYLPKVYREDEESASFLDRYLANPEGIFTALEDRIASAQVLFDPDAAPAETLDWLAGWFDVALDPGWDEHKRRLFIRNAWRFYRLRGTVRGLELALRLALEPCVDDEAFLGPEAEHRGPRIVERFRTRTVPAVALGDPSTPAGPRVVPARDRWRPSDGGEALHDRFRRFVQAELRKPEPDPMLVYTPAPPTGALADLWRRFSERELGFVPDPAAGPAWTDFLGRRYGRIEALRAAYGLAPDAAGSLEDVALPRELPPDGVRLRDWYQFHAVAVPMRRAAHAFTALLPVSAGESGEFDHEQRRALAARVVSLQKPAHTVFDVRFFWAAFRVGEARLQLDTVVDLGSRSPALLTPLRLGLDHLGESYLGGEPPAALTRPPSLDRPQLSR